MDKTVLFVKISYIVVFLGLIVAEILWKKQQKKLNRHEVFETKFNIYVGLLLGAFSFVIFAFSAQLNQQVMAFSAKISWIHPVFEFIAALLLVDFFYYWFHRFLHRVGIFWKAHFVHHSGIHYNLSLGPRQSIIQSLLSILFFSPLLLGGFSQKMLSIAFLVAIIYQFVTHLNWSRRIPVLDWIFVFPSHHMIHHSSHPKDFHKNFGGMLIIWDRVFGTYEHRLNQFEFGAKEDGIELDHFSFVRACLFVTYPLSYGLVKKK